MISPENIKLNDIYSELLIKFKFKVHYFILCLISYVFSRTMQISQGVLMKMQCAQLHLAKQSYSRLALLVIVRSLESSIA